MDHLIAEPRNLPALHALLESEPVRDLTQLVPRALVADAARGLLSAMRQQLLDGGTVRRDALEAGAFAQALRASLDWFLQPPLREVINATGVVLHTNLGRAPLAEAAAHAAAHAAMHYVDLEFDLPAGARGSRQAHLEPAIRAVTGAEAALVVNNNAAAVLLMLATLCRGREVLISRGELVEIGGSFRIPDVMTESGALLREVGTTNRTRVQDYAREARPETAAVLRVHPSNFRLTGFVERPARQDLAALAHRSGLWMLEDLGSGALVPLGDEPTVQSVLSEGADLVTLSGDKLLGGPQAGIIVGRRELVSRLRSAPLYRALRPDKMTVAALVETLRAYLRDPLQVPVQQMLQEPAQQVARRARRVARRLRQRGCQVRVAALEARAGGGSLPEEAIPSYGVVIMGAAPQALHERLRLSHPAVVGRVEEDRFLLDLRTVLTRQEAALVDAVARAVAMPSV